MNLLKAKLINFGSFEHLEFDFNSQGLALVHGPTGSGKSTLLDAAAWILYGRTAKDGSVDEVRSWTAPDEATTGSITVETLTGIIEVTRIRGKSYENDLYWVETEGKDSRGKDIKETQVLLNQRLGVGYEAFVLGSYFNEYSPAGSFFTAKSQDRRALFERLADLSLPVSLKTKIDSQLKELRKTEKIRLFEVSSYLSKIEQSKQLLDRAKEKAKDFDKDRKARVALISKNLSVADSSNSEKLIEINQSILDLNTQISTFVPDTCPECGRSDNSALITELKIKLGRALFKKEQVETFVNPFIKDLNVATKEINTYGEQAEHIAKQIETLEQIYEESKLSLTKIEKKISLLEYLGDLLSVLKVELLVKAIKQIESETNRYLSEYFDSELLVSFKLPDGESLDVSIIKNGHEAVFRQLSKGQKQLLKLSFALSIMKTSSNKAGVHFDCLLFDEPTDGLDTELKIKSHRIFDELSLTHSTVLVIDHSEDLKAHFLKKFSVALSEDKSLLSEG